MVRYALARFFVNRRNERLFRARLTKQLKSPGRARKENPLVPLEKVRLDRQDVSTLYFVDQAGRSVRVSVLERDLVRVSMYPESLPRLDRTWIIPGRDGLLPPEGRDRNDLSPFSLPAFVTDDRRDTVKVDTGLLHLVIDLGHFCISFLDPGERAFARDTGDGAYRTATGELHRVQHRMERFPGSAYWGFGETSGKIDKSGRTLTFAPVDTLGYDPATRDLLYTHVPFYMAYEPASGVTYGVLYDNLSITRFDIGRTEGGTVSWNADDGDIDYYLIYGPTPADVAVKYARLTGLPCLPPRYSLGYLAAGVEYCDSPDAQNLMARFRDACRKFDIPVSMFHLSSGVCLGDDNRRYVFTWSRKRVPDPAKLADEFREEGMRLSVHVRPTLLLTHPEYENARKDGLFIRESKTDAPVVVPSWGGTGSLLDFTNPIARLWWKKNVKDRLLSQGIEAVWNDGNEFEVWDDNARCEGFGRRFSVSQARPVQTMLMVQASREAESEMAPGKRPFVITRSAAPGMQRYAQVWTGANLVSWNSLKYGITLGLGLSVSGLVNFGHDAGGFWGGKPSPELFIRWIQSCLLLPRFSINSWHINKTVTEPWMYPKYLPAVRTALRFRYLVMPYLYALLFDAALTGRPPVRPLFFRFPGDQRCREESFDFMLGDKLLVAPVYRRGDRERSVYLPGEEKWIDFATGDYYSPGQTVAIDAPLDRLPLLVQEGGIIPVGKEAHSGKPDADDYRELRLFPHLIDGTGEFVLYEDDGESLDYQDGKYARVTVSLRTFRDHIEVEANKEGDYPLPYRQIACAFPPAEKRPVFYSGTVPLVPAGTGTSAP